MWNPFSSRQDPEPPAPEPAGDPVGDPDGSIAKVERVGVTAIATITVDGLTRDEGAEQLADLLHAIAETGAENVILDVQNVQFMDTACIGCLVEALNRLAAHGGRIVLACPQHNVDYVFRLTRLDRVFRICSSVMAALEVIDGTRRAG